MAKRNEARDWIEAHLKHTGKECLIYPYARDKRSGRAVFRAKGKKLYVYRLMCTARNGPPPIGQVARHTCNNNKNGCVNPMHLEWGTYSENSADMTRNSIEQAKRKLK